MEHSDLLEGTQGGVGCVRKKCQTNVVEGARKGRDVARHQGDSEHSTNNLERADGGEQRRRVDDIRL